MYSAFITIALITIVLAGWTGYSVFFQPTKSDEIISVINDIYVGQKLIIMDIIDLSKLLINDTNDGKTIEDKNSSKDSELMGNVERNSLSSESSNQEYKGDNPVGIFIEPSLSELSETRFPEISLEPLHNENPLVSMDGIEVEIDIK